MRAEVGVREPGLGAGAGTGFGAGEGEGVAAREDEEDEEDGRVSGVGAPDAGLGLGGTAGAAAAAPVLALGEAGTCLRADVGVRAPAAGLGAGLGAGVEKSSSSIGKCRFSRNGLKCSPKRAGLQQPARLQGVVMTACLSDSPGGSLIRNVN